MMKPLTVAIIGCGSIGTAIASGILDAVAKDDAASQLEGDQVEYVTATVRTQESKLRVESELSRHAENFEVGLLSTNLQAIQKADIVILAVKPFKRHEVLGVPSIREALRGKLLISVMAGISIADLSNNINGPAEQDGSGCQIVRAMPNMAARIRQAVTLGAVIPGQVSQFNTEMAAWIFSQVGQFKFIAESHFDIAGVLVGCSGSLMMLAVDGLLDAAVCEGLKRSEAEPLVVNSSIGMLGLIAAGGHPSVLRETIASPGGCSSRALLELENRGVRPAFSAAIMKAAEASRKMSKL